MSQKPSKKFIMTGYLEPSERYHPDIHRMIDTDTLTMEQAANIRNLNAYDDNKYYPQEEINRWIGEMKPAECPICLEQITRQDTINNNCLSCVRGHKFHRSHNGTRDNLRSCPICRSTEAFHSCNNEYDTAVGGRKRRQTIKKRKNNKSKTKRFMQNAGKLTAKQRQAIQESQQKKEQFRRMFINALNSNNIITQLTNGIKSNRTSINTLIPITNDFKPVTKEMGEQIVNFVPLLAILIHNINDTQGVKQIINEFVKNTGNINLKSTRQSITALSMAIEHRNGELVEALINSGADINTLDASQITHFNELMHNRELELNAPAINKLDLSIEVPIQGYDLSVEPEFWKPIFVKDELTNIKNRLQEMMNNDRQIPFVNYELDHIYSVCDIVKIMIPSFYVPSKNEPVYKENMISQESNLDFSNYNIILCTSGTTN